MMSPMVAVDAEHRPVVAAGAAGGSRIRPALVQSVLRMLNGEDPQAAIDQPRLNALPGLVRLEPGFSAEVIAALRAAGDEVVEAEQRDPYFGGVSALSSARRRRRPPPLRSRHAARIASRPCRCTARTVPGDLPVATSPSSTYRLQIRDVFTLADAAATSPLPARPRGGRDLPVADPAGDDRSTTATTPPIPAGSTPAGAARRAGGGCWRRPREHGLGVVVDIVPNHLGIAAPHENPAWWDVLQLGPESAYAEWFDIDWSRPDPRPGAG